MARYLVGEQKKSFFKLNNTWDWFEAIEAAQDGDIIELEKGYCPKFIQNDESLVLSKSITIEGNMEIIDEDKYQFTNVIDAVFATNGSTVYLKDLIVERGIEKSNALNVKNQSTLIGENIIVRNICSQGKMYPLVFIDENSTVQLDWSNVSDSSIETEQSIYVSNNSKFIANNSLMYAYLNTEKSVVKINDSTIKYFKRNAVSLINSEFVANNSIFDGGKANENGSYYSSIRAIDSKLRITDSNITSPITTVEGNALVTYNSITNLDNVIIDSFILEKQSIINLERVTINNHIQLKGQSKLKSTGFNLLGIDNRLINIFASGKSTIESDFINFAFISSPNIKLERNVEIDVKELNHFKFDTEKHEFVATENGLISIPYEEEITYFGALSAYERLNEMVGIESVKTNIQEFIAVAEVNKKREEKGLSQSQSTLHSLFLGNPGTGKTSVARIVGEILYEKGIVSKKSFTEVSRSDLVGQYIGHTAVKTKEILESSIGGVLFIDEAYTLSTGGENDFGLEAINEILKFMEDHRQDIVIIFAGYTQSMEKFLEMNEGLRSRIPNSFIFEDYNEEELIEIGLNDLQSQKYVVNENSYADLVRHNFSISNDNSNGRWIRNLNELILRKLAVRVSKTNSSDLSTITEEDLQLSRL